jgi:hypothetical protein
MKSLRRRLSPLLVVLVLASLVPVSASAQASEPPLTSYYHLTIQNGPVLATFSHPTILTNTASRPATMTLTTVLNNGRDSGLQSWYQQDATGSTRQTVLLAGYNAANQFVVYQLLGAWPSKLVESGGVISSVTISANQIMLPPV